MVVNVYVEGGVINGNVDATTSNNSEALREELNRFMQRALNFGCKMERHTHSLCSCYIALWSVDGVMISIQLQPVSCEK